MKKIFIISSAIIALLFGTVAATNYSTSLLKESEQQVEQTEQVEQVEQTEQTTPLSKYSVYYSLDNFPKYKEEAEARVRELLNTGLSEEEACDIALDELSDKIHELSMDFIHKNPNIEIEEYMDQYLKYIEPTQH